MVVGFCFSNSSYESTDKFWYFQMFTLAAKSVLPPCIGRTCTCTETFNDDGWDGAAATLELHWAVIGEEEDSTFSKQVGVQTSSVLVIEQQTAMTLDVDRTYTVQVEAGAWTGFVTNDIERFATVATVQIKVRPVSPVVRIKFGNRHLQWGARDLQKRLVLDASESWDPDGLPGDPRMQYFWYLDCPAMFLKLSQSLKDRHGINRKAYLQACEGTTLVLKILTQANRAFNFFFGDEVLTHYGADIIDTFALTDNDEGILLEDIQKLHPANTKFKLPLEIIIGLRLTDVDGSTSNDTVSILLSDPLPPQVRNLVTNQISDTAMISLL